MESISVSISDATTGLKKKDLSKLPFLQLAEEMLSGSLKD